ncbi:MAG: hypothetical protein Q9191_006091 [Dirinaria sp. TL-2023a]
MPRSRGRAAPARSAPSRPSTTQNRQVTPHQQQPNRAASTTAAQPPAGAAAGTQGAAGKSPGLFGQMASTAAGVAVGSSIGHAIGGMFGGSSSGSGVEAEGQQQQDNALAAQAQDGYQNNSNSWAQQSCEPAAKGLTSCLDQNNGNMQICTWYLEQLV